MPGYNAVQIMGNLTRDPELRYLPAGTAVCDLGVAVTTRRPAKGGETKEDTAFVDVTVWSKAGEACAQFLHKGSLVFIAGRLNFRQWEKDGQKRSKLDVTAETVQFLDGRKGEQAEEDPGGPPRGRRQDEAPTDDGRSPY